MSSTSIRIGVPQIHAKRAFEDRQFLPISPTTGGITFIESWTKQSPTRVEIKFTKLGSCEFNEKDIDKLFDIKCFKPPLLNGEQEVVLYENMKLVGITKSIGTHTPETQSFHFIEEITCLN